MEAKRVLANRYELIRKIGSGGMAVVYQAYDTALDRQVAVKLLRDEYVDDPDFIRRFQKEAQAVARLSHQNIVNIYDFKESDGLTYLLMEYVEGSTLKDIIAQSGPLPISQVIDYSVQLCYGLAQAHDQQLVHKDIKPHNIMIDRNHVVKITDFGIAQAMNNLTITHNKGILGSAHYFSPEQARGEHVDFKSDIYSLGVVMYEMVSGHVPFTGENPVTVALKHMQEAPPSLMEQRADVPLGLERIIFRALEKNPAYRFRSMQEMADALLDLRLYLEEQGYFQSEAVLTASEKEYVREYPKKAEDEKNERDRHHGGKAEQDNHTLVMKHGYLETESQEEPSRKVNSKHVLILVLAAVALFCGTFWAVQSFMSRDEVVVPDLRDKTLLEAEQLLSDNSLKIVVEDEVFDGEIEKDHIISQLPRAESKVKEGREVTVVISLGPDEVQVPVLQGKTEQEARIALENEGLELGEVKKVTDSSQPEDVVVYQSVEAGTTVTAGSKVDVMINEKAAEPAVVNTSVPNLVGKTQDEARKALANAKLSEGTVSQGSSNEYYSGYVSVQQTAAGSTVPEGSKVNYTVSTGPGPERSAQFELIIPEDGTVVVTLQDKNGSAVLYQKDCVAGERVQQSFLYHGSGTVRITCNDKEIWSKEYDG